MLDTNHQLFKLSESIDWKGLEKQITSLLGSDDAPQWRLVSAAIYLKSFYDLTSTEVIEKWQECPYHRFFCTGDVSKEMTDAFPLPQSDLDNLSCQLIGEGYEAMINALMVNSAERMSISPTVH